MNILCRCSAVNKKLNKWMSASFSIDRNWLYAKVIQRNKIGNKMVFFRGICWCNLSSQCFKNFKMKCTFKGNIFDIKFKQSHLFFIQTQKIQWLLTTEQNFFRELRGKKFPKMSGLSSGSSRFVCDRNDAAVDNFFSFHTWSVIWVMIPGNRVELGLAKTRLVLNLFWFRLTWPRSEMI